MKRLTDRNYKNTTLPLESCQPYLKLGRLEDIEYKIGGELEKVIDCIENGFTDKNGIFHKQGYLAYIDEEWCICDLKTDEWFLVSEVVE